MALAINSNFSEAYHYLGVTFVVLATFGATSYALFATSLRHFLASPRAQKAYGFFGGGLLCAAGIWALSARRVVT